MAAMTAVEATIRAAARARAEGTSVGEELTAPAWDPDQPEGMARGTKGGYEVRGVIIDDQHGSILEFFHHLFFMCITKRA